MKDCPSLQENNSKENDREPEKKPNMLFIINELCFIFAVIFTAYASFINSQSKTKKVSGAVPFFWPGCSVDDFYRGDLHTLMNNIGQSSVSLVMYYAPWDADSKDARLVLEEAAQFYGQEVYFASVNCWQPGSECRNTFKNIPRFPQIVAYKGPLNAVDYLGPVTSDDIIKFIDSVMNPIVRVNSVSEIWQLRFRHDAVLVGCLNMEGLRSSRGYNLLYKLAWKMSGRDHNRKLIFSVLTHDKINRALGVHQTPSFVLYTWNKRMEYSGDMNFDEIMKWIKNEMNKNELISSSLQIPSQDTATTTTTTSINSPVVVALFSSHAPLQIYNPYYHVLRQVAMKFNACVKNESIPDPEDSKPDYHDYSFYNHLFSGHNVYSIYQQDLIQSIVKEREICSRSKRVYRIETCSTNTYYTNARNISHSNNIWTNSSTCYQQTCPSNKLTFSEFPILDDETFEERYWRRRCRLLERSQGFETFKSDKLLHPDRLTQSVFTPDITSCMINKTVIFTLLSSYENPQLAYILGYQSQTPSLFIFNDDEVIRLSGSYISEKNISENLSQFLLGNNKRYLRYSPRHYPAESQRVRLQELNSANFHPVTFNNSKTVLVLFYSNSCGWCGTVSQTLLRVSHIFKHLTDIVIFTRINMDYNDLPFYLQVHTYPTLIIFPANRKSESRVYPAKQSWSLNTITQFILANLEPKQRVLAMIASCSKWGQSPSDSMEGEECIKDVRLGLIELISMTLRKWRTNINRRKYYHTLMFLKQSHLKLARVKNITNTVLTLLPHSMS